MLTPFLSSWGYYFNKNDNLKDAGQVELGKTGLQWGKFQRVNKDIALGVITDENQFEL